jgi:hypothetical protein
MQWNYAVLSSVRNKELELYDLLQVVENMRIEERSEYGLLLE